MGSGSNIECETQNEYTESDTTDDDYLKQNFFGTDPIMKRRRGCWTRRSIRGGPMCMMKLVELSHHKMRDLKLNQHKMRDKLLHELLKKNKAVEITTVILVVTKKIITDGLQK